MQLKYTQENLKALKKDQLIQIILNSQVAYMQLYNNYHKVVPTTKEDTLTVKELTIKTLTVLYKDTTISMAVKSQKHHDFIKDQIKDNKISVRLYHKNGYPNPTFQVITTK